MDEEKTVFTVNFKWLQEVGSTTSLKTFNNYTIIIINNMTKKKIFWVKCFCLCCLFLSQFNWLLWWIFKVLKISFWTFWRKNCISLNLWALFIIKLCKAFRIAQCKQPRLVKPCLNSDIYVIFQTFGTALLETTVSYKPLCSISQENRANPSPSASRHINNSLNLYLFFNFEEKNSIMNGLEYKLKGLLKAIFLSPKE